MADLANHLFLISVLSLHHKSWNNAQPMDTNALLKIALWLKMKFLTFGSEIFIKINIRFCVTTPNSVYVFLV